MVAYFILFFLIFFLFVVNFVIHWNVCRMFLCAAAAAKSLQSCLTLCNPMDGSPPGSPVPGILQARTLEWDAISFSNAWKWKVKVKSLSCGWLLETPWTSAYQAPLSMSNRLQINALDAVGVFGGWLRNQTSSSLWRPFRDQWNSY